MRSQYGKTIRIGKKMSIRYNWILPVIYNDKSNVIPFEMSLIVHCPLLAKNNITPSWIEIIRKSNKISTITYK